MMHHDGKPVLVRDPLPEGDASATRLQVVRVLGEAGPAWGGDEVEVTPPDPVAIQKLINWALHVLAQTKDRKPFQMRDGDHVAIGQVVTDAQAALVLLQHPIYTLTKGEPPE